MEFFNINHKREKNIRNKIATAKQTLSKLIYRKIVMKGIYE